MREINFRGLDINGNWHIGLVAESAGFSGQPERGIYISNTVGMPWAYQVRIETLGQYTGLKDKNGKEIYEGDIVKYNGWDKKEHIGVVEYKKESCAFVLMLEKSLGHSTANEKDEIIGNIYETPSLLSKEDGRLLK